MDSMMRPTILPMTCLPYHSPDLGGALDLCVRRRIENDSVDYTLSYPSPKRSPEYISSSMPRSPISECSENSDMSEMSKDAVSSTKTKTKRPFKEITRTFGTCGISLPNALLPGLDISYEDFRQRMLKQVQSNNNETNKNMRRNQNFNDKNVDPCYLEKRRRNNEAAKRSRDARKAKEDEIAIRCAYLEQENLKLKLRITDLERDKDTLQNMLYRQI